MANSRTRYYRRKTDAWAVYDALPPAIRAALQEGPQEWDAVWAHTMWRRHARVWGPKKAIRVVVAALMTAHQSEIEDALPWQPRRNAPKAKRIPSPHLLAKATMQTSGRPAP